MARCAACKEMIESTEETLILSNGWLKRIWTAHRYKDHKL